MRIALLSDIHANRQAFQACLAAAEAAGAEQFVVLGDIVGYGADPAWCVEKVQEMQVHGAIVVQGNHDAAVAATGPDLSMQSVAGQAVNWTRTQLAKELSDGSTALSYDERIIKDLKYKKKFKNRKLKQVSFMYNNENEYSGTSFEYNNGFAPGNNGFAFAALILGVSALFSLFTVYLPLILGSLAILFALLSKGYGKKMAATAKIGFISAITGLSLILSLLAVGITSLYLLFATSTDDQLLHYGSQIDQAIEMQLGQSTEEMFGTSYEDMMEQLVALRDAATGTGVQ